MLRQVARLSMLCAITFPAFAQIDTEIQTAIPAPLFSTVRSSIFTASEGDIIVVKVNGPEQLSIEASVYDDRHMLVEKEDPEEQRAEFQYIVAVTGKLLRCGAKYLAGRWQFFGFRLVRALKQNLCEVSRWPWFESFTRPIVRRPKMRGSAHII